MADWPLRHDGPCACRFVRREEFGEAEQTEWCGLHARQRDELERLQAAVGKAIHWAEHAMLMRSSQNKELLGILQGAVPNA